MTSKNHTAFLMCPTNRAAQLGGTPLESGRAGGHIKKANWVHVLDALPLRLKLPCEITSFKLDQFVAGQAAANLCFIDGLATVGSGKAKLAQLGGGQVGYRGDLHGLGLCWNSGSAVNADEFRPDQVPVSGAKVPAAKLGMGLLFNANALNWVRRALSVEGLQQHRGLDTSHCGETLAVIKRRRLMRHQFGHVASRQLARPLAGIGITQVGKPFVEVTPPCSSCAAADQLGLTPFALVLTLDDQACNQLDADARNTALVLLDAFVRGGAASYLDVAVAKVADIKKYGHSGLLFGRFREVNLPAFNGVEIVDQGLNGLDPRVLALGVVGDFSREGFCDTRLIRDKFPAGGAGLFQLALEVFND